MSFSSPQLDRAGLKRTSSNLKSYVDLTLSESEEEEEMETRPPKQHSKRQRIASLPSLPAIVSADVQVDATPPASSEESLNSDDELGDEEYEIDYIVNSRFRSTRGRRILEYLIHWKDYPVEDRSWTLASQFEDDDPPVAEFYAKNPKKPRIGPSSTHEASPKKLTPARTTASRPTRTTPAKTAPESSPVKKASSSQLKGGDLRSYFGVQPKGKENVDIGSSSAKKEIKKIASRPELTKNETKPAKPKVVENPKQKKRKSDSDESDFIMQDDEALSSGDDFEASEDSGSDDGPVPSDDLESDEEEVRKAPKKSAVAKSKNGGWGGANKSGKVPKQAPPRKIDSFRTGVAKLSGGDASAKNLSEDLPPLSDIEMMFDHLISRVPDIVQLVERLNGRSLRVATMCS